MVDKSNDLPTSQQTLQHQKIVSYLFGLTHKYFHSGWVYLVETNTNFRLFPKNEIHNGI